MGLGSTAAADAAWDWLTWNPVLDWFGNTTLGESLEEMLRRGPWVSETFSYNPPVSYSSIEELTVKDPDDLSPAERARLEATVRDSQARLREWEQGRTTIDDVVRWGSLLLLVGGGGYLAWKAWPWLQRQVR